MSHAKTKNKNEIHLPERMQDSIMDSGKKGCIVENTKYIELSRKAD